MSVWDFAFGRTPDFSFLLVVFERGDAIFELSFVTLRLRGGESGGVIVGLGLTPAFTPILLFPLRVGDLKTETFRVSSSSLAGLIRPLLGKLSPEPKLSEEDDEEDDDDDDEE